MPSVVADWWGEVVMEVEGDLAVFGAHGEQSDALMQEGVFLGETTKDSGIYHNYRNCIITYFLLYLRKSGEGKNPIQ